MIRVVLKSKKELHYAEAIIDDKETLVLKGAKINLIESFPQMSQALILLRRDRMLVSEDGVLLKDIKFTSPSTAAQFVTGRSVNGYIAWRPNDEISLKEYLGKRREI
ncbi:MAG: DUF4357 domain-containing protein [Clostridiales bacterium]|nr:DUF4357 domain-containing protein [Clostridiales bacterium]